MSDINFEVNPKYDMTDEFNRKAIVKEIGDDLKENTIFGALSFEEGFKLRIDNDHKEVKVLNDYFKSSFDSDVDTDIKKVVSTATVIAKEKGFVSGKYWDNKSPSDIANIVDDTMTKAKLAYKVSTGEFEPMDAVDFMIDRTTARISTVISQKCIEVGTATGSAIGGAIGSIFGPAGTAIGSTVGAVVGGVVGKVAGTVITKGIEIVSDCVKSVARGIWDVGTSIVSGICDLVGGLFGW